MKRRSPWLAFAACALLNGTMAAEPAPSPVERPQTAPATVNNRPGLALSKAAGAAEAELEKRGLAKDHVVSSVSLVSSKDGASWYVAHVDPPVLTPIEKAGADSAPTATATKLAFQVGMDGQVTAKQVDPKQVDPARQRVRVIKSN